MTQPLRIALAGLGTVGAGVIKLIEANRALVERRAGRAIQVVAVTARDRDRDRGVDLSAIDWVDDALALVLAALWLQHCCKSPPEPPDHPDGVPE